MSESLQKFQNLLRELFEFDMSDLDFGIYRILNHKRKVIEKFIQEDLPKAISEELNRGTLGEQIQAQRALEKARERVLEALGHEALDANGNLAEKYRDTNIGKAYLEAQAHAKGSRSTEALEATIYNHLYTFFSRYWQEGDFILNAATPRKNATPSPTTARKFSFTGPTMTSTTSRPASTSPTTPTKPPTA